MADAATMITARQVGDRWREPGDVVLATETNVGAPLLDALIAQGWAKKPGTARPNIPDNGGDFGAPATVFQIRASGKTAATVTVTGYAGSQSAVLATLDVPADGSAVVPVYAADYDSFRWESTATDTTVEVL